MVKKSGFPVKQLTTKPRAHVRICIRVFAETFSMEDESFLKIEGTDWVAPPGLPIEGGHSEPVMSHN